MTDSADIIKSVATALTENNADQAKSIINQSLPFTIHNPEKRMYSDRVKTRLFMRDGFVDRYDGHRLVFIGMLRLISTWLPDEFPYHPNWRLDSCHESYYDLTPTLDHVVPVVRGGKDEPENWVTTSQKNNSIKAHYNLEELGWRLQPSGHLDVWDGLIVAFVQLVDANPDFMTAPGIKSNYRTARAVLTEFGITS